MYVEGISDMFGVSLNFFLDHQVIVTSFVEIHNTLIWSVARRGSAVRALSVYGFTLKVLGVHYFPPCGKALMAALFSASRHGLAVISHQSWHQVAAPLHNIKILLEI